MVASATIQSGGTAAAYGGSLMAAALVVADRLAQGEPPPSLPVIGRARLDSWKQIAAFFDRTQRTVQRWERKEGLPVRRHIHERFGSVYAFERELVAWRDSRSQKRHSVPPLETAISRRVRLAVLPFADLSANSQLSDFEDGLTSEIIGHLAQLDPARLGIIARASIRQYKTTACDVTQIGRSLNVDYLLEGSVRLTGYQLRIAARLIDVADQTHIFADTCARRWNDGAAIQVAFAMRITNMVAHHLWSTLLARSRQRTGKTGGRPD